MMNLLYLSHCVPDAPNKGEKIRAFHVAAEFMAWAVMATIRMCYDTPEPPVAEMRYVDRTAKAGEKHTYAVVTINSAGLRSKTATQ